MNRERDNYLEDHKSNNGLYKFTHQTNVILLCSAIILVSGLIIIGRLLI